MNVEKKIEIKFANVLLLCRSGVGNFRVDGVCSVFELQETQRAS